MKCVDIEIAVANMMDYRKNIIIPNISWGAGLHECDLLIINKDNYATEVEIKISKADLKKDMDKGHGHKNSKIKNLYYAIPKKLLSAIEYIPDHAGIIVCEKIQPAPYTQNLWDDKQVMTEHIIESPAYILCTYHRPSKPIHDYRKMTDPEIRNICRLGCMRIWNLKKKLKKLTNDTLTT